MCPPVNFLQLANSYMRVDLGTLNAAWPSISWTWRMSAPLSNIKVAVLCLKRLHAPRFLIPTSLTCLDTRSPSRGGWNLELVV